VSGALKHQRHLVRAGELDGVDDTHLVGIRNC
jgi:hypothetical protein